MCAFSADDFTLRMFNVNGDSLASEPSAERITAMLFDGDAHVVTAGEKGNICVRASHDLQTVDRFNVKSSVRSMAFGPGTPVSHLILGLDDGRLLIVTRKK